MTTCTRCHREVEDDSAFCRHCGLGSPAVGPSGPRRLYRRPDAGRLGGVCAGLAEYVGVDVTLVRVIWVVLSIVPGGVIGGVLAYLVAAMVMPAMPGGLSQGSGRRRLVRSLTDRKVAGVCGGLASYMQVDGTVVRLGWVMLTIFPGAVVFGVAAYAVAWFAMPEGLAAGAAPAVAAA